jgi:hypothetical protein
MSDNQNIEVEYIRMELNDADAALLEALQTESKSRKEARLERAAVKFRYALTLANRLDKDMGVKARVTGSLLSITAFELIDYLRGGHHPILDLIFGGLAGFFAGKKVAEYYSDTLTPLRVRARRGLGDVARAKGDMDEARKHYVEAWKESPNDPITRKNLGEAL